MRVSPPATGSPNDRPRRAVWQMTHLDLFSGIGGFALAAKWNGLRTVQFVEIDPFCQRVLAKHWPGVPCHDDIKTFHHAGERPFILTGGFPCQPFSFTGKRRGKGDDRYLWPEMCRVIREARPSWIICENVPGIDGMALSEVYSDLAGSGYEVANAFEIPACAVGADQKRSRIWVVSNSMLGDEALARNIPGSRRESKQIPRYGVCDAKSEPGMVGVVDGVSNWLDEVARLRALGNAIVPQVAAEIIRCIVEADKQQGEKPAS